MVSALTGKLFAGYSSGGSLDSLTKNRKSSNTSGSTNGYAGDDDQVGRGGQPPSVVDLEAKLRNKDDIGKSSSLGVDFDGIGKISTKRRRMIELEFAAHNVKAELSQAGIEMQEPRVKAPRLLPPCSNVDMSSVTLMKSSDFAKLDLRTVGCTWIQNNRSDICFNSISSLTQACRDFYQLPCTESKIAFADCSDDGSTTTSSVSGSGSGSEDEEPSKPFMAMCEALSLCKQPRIVVLSSSPFTVVHVNAAYLQLTGLSSVRLLGQPLQDLLLDGKWTAALSRTKSDGSDFDLRQMNKRVVKTRTGTQKGSPMQCTVSASPIGVAADRITHFALVLEQCQGDERSINTNSVLDLTNEDSTTPPMTVSG